MVVSFTGIANVVQSIRAVTPSSLTRCFLGFQNSDSDASRLRRCTDGRQPPSSAGLFSSDRLADRACRIWPPQSLHPCETVWNRLGDTHTVSCPLPPLLLLSPRAQQMKRREGITRNINNIDK